MSDPEVVVRLLAAIDERERKARDAAGFGRGGDWSLAEERPRAWGDPELDPTLLAGGKPVARFNVEYGGSFNADHAEANDPDAVIRLCQSHRDIVAMFPVSEPHVDTHGSFYGFQSRDCGEHRTVGPHRAWCYDCSEWCSPNTPCQRCHGVSDVIRALARGYGVEDT